MRPDIPDNQANTHREHRFDVVSMFDLEGDTFFGSLAKIETTRHRLCDRFVLAFVGSGGYGESRAWGRATIPDNNEESGKYSTTHAKDATKSTNRTKGTDIVFQKERIRQTNCVYCSTGAVPRPIKSNIDANKMKI